MKIEIEVSEKNESTSYPWWIIIDPHTIDRDPFSRSVNGIAHCISGLFFSRESAQAYLDSHHYDFSKDARVYCKSGYHSLEYKQAFERAAMNKIRKELYENKTPESETVCEMPVEEKH